jgi:hypothetical protein
MMLRPPIVTICSGAVMFMLALGGITPATAQKTTLDASTLTASKNPAVIRNQLMLAARLGRTTLAGLEAASPDGPLPMDESVVQPARDTYVLIRAALQGLEHVKESERFPDPLIDLVHKRVLDAWNLSRTPVDLSNREGTRQDYLGRAIPDLRQALRLIDQALVLLP